MIMMMMTSELTKTHYLNNHTECGTDACDLHYTQLTYTVANFILFYLNKNFEEHSNC